MKGRSLLVLLFGIYTSAYSSNLDTATCTKDSVCYANPQIVGILSGRGVLISKEYTSPIHVNSTSYLEGIQSTSGTIHRIERWSAKARVPLWDSPKLKVVVGASYDRDEFQIEDNSGLLQNPFFKAMNNKSLKSLGFTVYAMRSFDEKRFLIFRGSYNLQGDYSKIELPKAEFRRYTAAIMYGWVLKRSLAIAPGLNYTDVFGRKSFVPVLLYNNTFNSKWGVETVLPVEARLRYNITRKMVGYLSAEVDGTKYHISLESPTIPNQKAFYGYSDARLTLIYEQKIVWWLWYGIEAGGVYNISSKLTEKDVIIQSADRNFIKNDLGISALANAKLFLRTNNVRY